MTVVGGCAPGEGGLLLELCHLPALHGHVILDADFGRVFLYLHHTVLRQLVEGFLAVPFGDDGAVLGLAVETVVGDGQDGFARSVNDAPGMYVFIDAVADVLHAGVHHACLVITIAHVADRVQLVVLRLYGVRAGGVDHAVLATGGYGGRAAGFIEGIGMAELGLQQPAAVPAQVAPQAVLPHGGNVHRKITQGFQVAVVLRLALRVQQRPAAALGIRRQGGEVGDGLRIQGDDLAPVSAPVGQGNFAAIRILGVEGDFVSVQPEIHVGGILTVGAVQAAAVVGIIEFDPVEAAGQNEVAVLIGDALVALPGGVAVDQRFLVDDLVGDHVIAPVAGEHVVGRVRIGAEPRGRRFNRARRLRCRLRSSRLGKVSLQLKGPDLVVPVVDQFAVRAEVYDVIFNGQDGHALRTDHAPLAAGAHGGVAAAQVAYFIIGALGACAGA